MSVIQKIQERYAKLMAIIIAVALMIFVVMLAFENGGSLFRGGNSTAVGKVNGKSIDYNDFLKKVEGQEQQYARQYGEQFNVSTMRPQIINSVWNNEINESLLANEVSKLGITVGKREMGDVLYGPNAPTQWKRLFMASDSDVFNGQRAKVEMDRLLKKTGGKPEEIAQREQFVDFINGQQAQRLNDKYNSLFINSINYPKWFIEKQNADNSQMARVSFVTDNYAANIVDSLMKISDVEVKDYVDKHKKDFKEEAKESRSISYVSFSALPNSSDSTTARTAVEAVKPEFDTTKNVRDFLMRNNSSVPYADVYAGKSLMQMPQKDTIQKLAIGAVYGPYLDGGSYAMAKMLDIKTLPDSVKCRHVLVSTNPQQGGFEDSVAAKKIDSIKNAINGGAAWADMVNIYNPASDGSRQNKGEMSFSSTDIQNENFAKEFAQFILFDGKPGDKKVVKTSFGYHYIEILSVVKPEPHYKVAYMAKRIETSQTTYDNASNEASLFAGEARDLKSFEAKAKARGLTPTVSADITPMSDQVIGLAQDRQFVKTIYKADRGEVMDPQKVGEFYVVAVVTGINEEGDIPLFKIRPVVEQILKKKKAAELLKKKIGNVTTLEAAAAALGGKPIVAVDSVRISGIQSNLATNPQANIARNLQGEPAVLGAIFNPANKGKVVPQVIEGKFGVYVVRVDDVMATPLAEANVVDQRKTRYQQSKMAAQRMSPLSALQDAAKIKDRRSEFF